MLLRLQKATNLTRKEEVASSGYYESYCNSSNSSSSSSSSSSTSSTTSPVGQGLTNFFKQHQTNLVNAIATKTKIESAL